MSAGVLLNILLGVLTVVVGLASYILATRAETAHAKAAQVAVDAGAYERAREIYESALRTMREELESTRQELFSARQEIHQLRQEISSLRSMIKDSQGHD